MQTIAYNRDAMQYDFQVSSAYQPTGSDDERAPSRYAPTGHTDKLVLETTSRSIGRSRAMALSKAQPSRKPEVRRCPPIAYEGGPGGTNDARDTGPLTSGNRRGLTEVSSRTQHDDESEPCT